MNDHEDGSPSNLWEDIAQRITAEQDPHKLPRLVASLMKALDEQGKERLQWVEVNGSGKPNADTK